MLTYSTHMQKVSKRPKCRHVLTFEHLLKKRQLAVSFPLFGIVVISRIYEGWNFNFGNTPLDWIQELLE